MTPPNIQNISPRWSLHTARPDAVLVWARTAISSEIFKSYTTAFLGSVQEIKCKPGQSSPDCSHLIEQADIDAGMNYDPSEIGEEREWHLLVSPSKAGWIISFQRSGVLDFEFRLLGFTELEEDTPGSGLIVHSGEPVWSKSYESTFLEPKGHAVCVYTP
jgi:hypothetical protein